MLFDKSASLSNLLFKLSLCLCRRAMTTRSRCYFFSLPRARVSRGCVCCRFTRPRAHVSFSRDSWVRVCLCISSQVILVSSTRTNIFSIHLEGWEAKTYIHLSISNVNYLFWVACWKRVCDCANISYELWIQLLISFPTTGNGEVAVGRESSLIFCTSR